MAFGPNRIIHKEHQLLVTGASGFVGSHADPVVGARLHCPWHRRDTSRSGTLTEMFAKHCPGKSVELFSADLSNDTGWEEAIAGCDYILHIASPIPLSVPRDRDALVGPARDGALRVLKLAKAHGVKRVVMTSSIAAIGYGPQKTQSRPYTEEDWTDPDYPKLNAYLRSKTLAEMAAWDYVNNEGKGLELSVVNPGLILGPVLENDVGTSVEAIKQLMTGELPLFPRIGFSVVDVRDVASCHILAMTTPEAAGERFICGGEFAWFSELGAVLRKAYPDRRLPTRTAPDFLLWFLSFFNSALTQVLDDLGRTQIVSHEKATRVLGWEPRSIEDAVLATSESLIERGIVS